MQALRFSVVPHGHFREPRPHVDADHVLPLPPSSLAAASSCRHAAHAAGSWLRGVASCTFVLYVSDWVSSDCHQSCIAGNPCSNPSLHAAVSLSSVRVVEKMSNALRRASFWAAPEMLLSWQMLK
eukprot:CAMPEP_0180320808 /NCGR_PEP_ID=MMETSP0988-20121125/35780_1 /TAXON_ID=697907 /ORGANISM="non described non described, Strain CCMP2293" /LENGTH=124 /DNA_ID=CAMNT_0022306579 /DNA_START=275 /DNA_END=649 /DNA_ORIENTATION=+